MKLNNKTIIYIYIAVLFILTFLFTRNLMKGFKSQEFDYLKLSVNLVLLVYIIVKVVKLGKIENNTNDQNEK
jgi:hypothetical protein